MSTLDRPAEPMHREAALQSTPMMPRKVLLACGILAALLYAVAHDVLAAILYPNYSSFSQTISELGSIGAPTRPAVTAVVLIHEALLIAFGIGIWQSGRGNRALRVTGALLIVYGAIGPLWLPFPITARGEIATAGGLNDVMHVVLRRDDPARAFDHRIRSGGIRQMVPALLDPDLRHGRGVLDLVISVRARARRRRTHALARRCRTHRPWSLAAMASGAGHRSAWPPDATPNQLRECRIKDAAGGQLSTR